jgi:hypothetical protein
MFKNKKLGFYCFSPPVMIATFAVEIALMALTIIHHKLNRSTKLICATLFCLALFQLCEYFVCGGMGVGAVQWSRLGFISITILPPLGLHLVHSIANKKTNWIVWAGYSLMMFWIIVFGFGESAFTGHQCVSNYVIFQLHHYIGYAYSAYYYGLLLVGIMLALWYGEHTKSKQQTEALFGIILGYLTFLLPTAVANTVNPETMAGIPSIMCGFAVLFALTLFFYILPRVTKVKS